MGRQTRKQGVAGVELSQYACQAPHVDCRPIAQAQHDFRRAVEAALDVTVHLLPLKAAAAKVYHLHATRTHSNALTLYAHLTIHDDCNYAYMVVSLAYNALLLQGSNAEPYVKKHTWNGSVQQPGLMDNVAPHARTKNGILLPSVSLLRHCIATK